LLFNLATYYKDATMATFDIKGAFLHAAFNKKEDGDEVTYIRVNKEVTELWIQQDPTAAPYVEEDGSLILELDKFIYGLKQSPYKFQLHLQEVLVRLGYKQMVNDECIYVKHVDDKWSVLSIHVDDILQVTTDRSLYSQLADGLKQAYGEITPNEKATSYLGMSIARSADGSFVKLSQKGLIKDIMDGFLPKGSKAVKTPAGDDLLEGEKYKDAEHNDPTTFYRGEKGPPDIMEDKPDDAEEVSKTEFLGLVMKLMYVARLTRPDILLPTTYLASRSHVATKRDHRHLERIVKYLKGTEDVGITVHCTDISLHCNCDASYGSHKDGMSHTGFFVGLGSDISFLHCRSGKQKLSAQSSTDAEGIAMIEAVKFMIWMRNLIAELQITPLRPIVVEQDNISCIKLHTENTKAKRSKHLLTKIAYIRNMVNMGAVELVWTPTDEMSSDALTKPLHGAKFFKHMSTILGLKWKNEIGV
jgi:hypothetical protein